MITKENIYITKNEYELNLEDIMEIGKRVNNTKRDFLFINKLLGKHLEVKPDIVKCTGRLLTSLKYPLRTDILLTYIHEQNIDISKTLNRPIPINQKTLVIGFSETATGLGMSVAASIKNATYVTTTRETILNEDVVFTFEEEHSHATTHILYFDAFDNYDQIILVDDEMTTGKSMLNLIKNLVDISGVKDFSIFSILDWRNENDIAEFNRFQWKENVSIKSYSLIHGIIKEETTETVPLDTEFKLEEKLEKKYDFTTLEKRNNYWKESGKFGIDTFETLENECKELAKKIESVLTLEKNDKILVLGHGENIYIPSRIASYLSYDTYFKTTTRSPIYVDGKIIKDRNYFYENSIKYYFYNKEEIEKTYKKVIMIAEQPFDVKLSENFMAVYV